MLLRRRNVVPGQLFKWPLGGLFCLALTSVASAEITCPTNRTIVASANCTAALADLRGEVQSGDPGAVVSVTQDPPADTQVGLGTNHVVFTVTYTNGLADTCTALITVVDAAPPVMTCPPNKIIPYTVAWTFDAPSATDTCGTNTLTVVHTTTNWTCGAAYVATRLWQAVDAFGNSATCTQVVTVVDTTPPLMMCPTNLTVECSNPWSFGTPVAADKGLGSALVYNNAVNDLSARFDTGTNEVGNEILLAGEERYLQGFS